MEKVIRTKYEFKATKQNACSTIYQLEDFQPALTWLTQLVKLENFQGFSKAINLTDYLRLRGATSWKAGEQVTGLFKTEFPNIFFGDKRTHKGKGLIQFVVSNDRSKLVIYIYPDGYYPSLPMINQLCRGLRG